MKARSRVLWMVLVGLFFCSAGIRSAGVSHASKPEAEMKELRGKIRQEEGIVRKIKKRKATILGAVETLDRRIAESRNKHRSAQAQVEKLTGELNEIKKDLSSLNQQIQKQVSATGYRLTAFYRLGRAGVLPVLFSQNALPDKLRNLNAMKRILGADWRHLQTFHDLVSTKEATEKKLKQRRQEHLELRETVRIHMEEQKEERRQKDALLFSLGQDEQIHKQLIKELTERADRLEEWIKEEQKKKEAETARTAGFASESLTEYKGRLPWPVEGDLYRGYGETFDPLHQTTIMNKGIDIQVQEGAPVRCVCGGEVVFADWFQGYGRLVIVHHGEKNYTVFGHMDRLTKRKNERVEPGEVIGYAGDTGSVEGCLVHFEVWYDGNHCDPLGWIRGGKHASKKLPKRKR